MLLNVFFDNMNAKLELVLIGTFFVAFYWFVLRKYYSLGFRLFFLCICLFVACCTWLYKDETSLKNTMDNGEEYVATVLAKAVVGQKKDYEVEVTFTTKDGKMIDAKTSKYVSAPEWNKIEIGKPLSVLYVAERQETYVQQSVMRFKGDKIVLYYVASFWLLLGIILFILLRNYKVGVNSRERLVVSYEQ